MAWLAFHKRQNTAANNNVFTNPSLQIFGQCYNYHNYDVFFQTKLEICGRQEHYMFLKYMYLKYMHITLKLSISM